MRNQICFKLFIGLFLSLFCFVTTIQAEQLSALEGINKDSLFNKIAAETNATEVEDPEVTKLRTALVGEWESPHFMVTDEKGRDTNTRSLRYHFRADGTYTKTLGGAEVQIQEQGTWTLSDKGTTLLMQSNIRCDNQVVNQTATIKHFAFDELVLEQSMCVAGTVVSTEPKEFYFNKF